MMLTQTQLDALWALTLANLRIGLTQDNLDFHTSWHRREGGNATWNSLNTTWPMAGAIIYNTIAPGVHVYNYPDAKSGAKALALTLAQPGFYPNILHGLQTGTPWLTLPSMAPDFRRWSGTKGYSTIPVYHSQGDTDMTPQESAQLAGASAALARLETAIEDPNYGLRALVIAQGKVLDQLLAKP